MRTIYLDTVIWNRLLDQKVDAGKIVSALKIKNKMLVLGTEAIYEMAKSHRTNPGRCKDLFSYIKTYTDIGISCPLPNPNILRSELDFALSGSRSIEIMLNSEDHKNMKEEVNKLSNGVLDNRVRDFIRDRQRLAANVRAAMSAQYQTSSLLKKRLSGISVSGLEGWMRKEILRLGRQILKNHFKELFPEFPEKRLTFIAKRLLADSWFRLANAVVRADLYTNWRIANTESMPRDLLPDLDHIVTATYFDVYATAEAQQAKYAPLILKRATKIAIYDGTLPIATWFESI